MSAKVLGILLFDEVEVLDFCGPFEVFSITGTLLENSFEVVTLAQKSPVTARNGLAVLPNYVIGQDQDIPKLDILIVPGGMGTVTEAKNESLISWIKSVSASAEFVLSVCTGVQLLGKAGLLDGMTVTTHHLCFELVRPDCPTTTKFCKCRRFVDNDKVLTSAGISAGIDLSFHLVKKLHGLDSASKVAKYMEYDWKDVDVQKCICQLD
ncbi:isonitrile hydratase-like protein xanA [Folsomia candida]|uniref:isonitrile hydratase-like protein xanA n=1 Tax=Folsomia candida TaxID=158441 RepID=UPI0016052B09|nr:isonitrile hydratase-like protein xanA [Folsomia candida]